MRVAKKKYESCNWEGFSMGEGSNYCKKCGNPLLEDDKFCSNCGAAVTSEESTSSNADQSPEASNNSDKHLPQDALDALASLDEVESDGNRQTNAQKSKQDNSTPQNNEENLTADKKTEITDASLNNEKTQIFDAVPLSAASQYQIPTTPQQDSFQTPTKEFPAVSNPPAPQGQPIGSPQIYRAAPPQEKKSLSKKQLGIIIGATAVVVIAIIVAVVLVLTSVSSNEQETTQDTQTTTEATAPDQSTGQETAESSIPTSSEDRNIYNRLNTFYDHLGSYHNQIASAANVFNNTYISTSYSQRASARSDAYDIMNDLSKEMDELEGLYVPTSSEYYSCYNDISTCYYDCYMRISVICEAWDNSISYSNPADYTDEITEPIARDNVDGTNKYLTEFNSLYEGARPAAPRN